MSGLDQTQSGGQTTVTVKQSAQQALLNWQTFNIGGHTTLNFDQSAGGASAANWIAFNKVNDPLGRPSQIMGKINALGPDGTPQSGGQVYVINANGIIFGGSSQVNARSLVVSSLPINTNLLNNGLLNNQDSEFLFSALPTGTFTPPAIIGVYGDVEIQPGAQITAVPGSDNSGGLVALIGPNVYNGGTISTPYGQTILAAGLQVGLAAHPSSDPTLRGLDAYVGEVADLSLPNQPAAGIAENGDPNPTTGVIDMGDIESQYGDATMIGQTVNQLGVINSSTSVTLNGRIDLLADYGALNNSLAVGANESQGLGALPPFIFSQTGTVALGPGSVTQILPDNGTVRVVGTQLALPALVNIQGNSIHLQSDVDPNTGLGDPASGAVIFAPGANDTSASLDGSYSSLGAGVTLNAGSWHLQNVLPGTQPSSVAKDSFVNPTSSGGPSASQITLDPYTIIDVSGSEDVPASVSEDIVPVQLLGTQLADSPVQRNGPIRGQTIQVDVLQTGTYNGQAWVGTPLGDTTGYINLIQRSAGELTASGGTVAFTAGDEVLMQPNSTVNVSGGWINYQGGVVETTQVMADGHIMDISKATPDLVLQGIYTGTETTTDAKWGVTQTYTNAKLGNSGQYNPGYIQGGNAGSISITAPTMTLYGSFLGNTVAGPNQRTPNSQVAATFGGTTIVPTMESILSTPVLGALTLTFQGENSAGGLVASATSQNIIFGPASERSDLSLSPDIVNLDGFGNLTLDNPGGNITVPVGVSLIAPTGSSNVIPSKGVSNPLGATISFTGANITIDGSVSAPSGSLSFTVDDISPLLAAPLAFVPVPVPIPPADLLPGQTNDSTLAAVNPVNGQFTLGQTSPGQPVSASLSTAGLIVDDRRTDFAAGTIPLFIDGGTVTIKAYRTDLSAGKSIDVSGGVGMSATGKPTYGAGGALTINGGQDPAQTYSYVGLVPGANDNYLGQLILGATLTGYSGQAGSGGALNLLAPSIQIGGNQLLTGNSGLGRTLWLNQMDSDGNILPQTDSGGNPLPLDFFSRGGFSNFTLQGLGNVDVIRDSSGKVISDQYSPGLVVASNTTINPQVSSWLAVAPADGSLGLEPTLPMGSARYLRTPASLTFKALGIAGVVPLSTDSTAYTGDLRGDLVIGSDATIETDPMGKVTLSGNTVAVLGSIYAPGGTISITGGKLTASVFTDPADVGVVLPTVDLGPASILSAGGEAVLAPNTTGRPGLNLGAVVPGGMITVDGNIVAEYGATLDVSGASGQFNVLSSYTGTNVAMNGSTTGANYVGPVTEDSNGGTIALIGEEELFSDATLSARAGGLSASGGSLIVSGSNAGNNANAQQPTLILTQSGRTIPNPSFYPSGQTAIGNPVLGLDGKPLLPVLGYGTTPILGEGYIAASSFNNGGFASVELAGSV
ncbi:MAG TPA: filamentous hemagglutinin N-terminal domain-containing protein, partial [Gemmataceae bacterium]|nr:filamentous hemagglutinin N-terminal domain-containing protein [Gemmataceae bacterium]